MAAPGGAQVLTLFFLLSRLDTCLPSSELSLHAGRWSWQLQPSQSPSREEEERGNRTDAASQLSVLHLVFMENFSL